MTTPVAQVAKVVISAFLVSLLISEALIFVPPLEETLAVNVSLTPRANTVTVSTTVRSTYPVNLQESVYLTPTFHPRTVVSFYFDSSYPFSYSNIVDWYGLSQHLTARAAARGQTISEELLNATGLALTLRVPPSNGSVLVMASGVLPDTVFSSQNRSLVNWIEQGGALIWLGERLGAYSGSPGRPLNTPESEAGAAGSAQFFNLTQLGGTSLSYVEPTVLSQSFGLNYTLGIPGNDWNLTQLGIHGNLALGTVADGSTNIALLHLGRGEIVDFGAPPYDPNAAAQIILNLMMTGFLSGNITLLSSTALNAQRGTTIFSPQTVTLPTGLNLTGSSVCAFTFQTDYLGPYVNTTCGPLA